MIRSFSNQLDIFLSLVFKIETNPVPVDDCLWFRLSLYHSNAQDLFSCQEPTHHESSILQSSAIFTVKPSATAFGYDLV